MTNVSGCDILITVGNYRKNKRVKSIFKIKKYKIGDIVTCNNKLWEIEDINTTSVPRDADDMIELGLVREENYYSYILVLLKRAYEKNGRYICVYLNELNEENKDMTTDEVKNILNGITSNIPSNVSYNYGQLKDGELYVGDNYVGTLINKASLSKNDPVIVDYKVIDNTVVIFTFFDGTTEKTVCNREFDEFELWRAVELAICKKKFGGTKAYHKAVNNAIKQIENIDAKKKAEAAEQERIAHRKAKYAERQAKRKAKRRQEQIDIQTEAFYNAMMKYDDAMAVNNVNKDSFAEAVENNFGNILHDELKSY